MTAYYNEFDPYAAQWLRNLIAAGHIAPGDVDERSILDVSPDDLRDYRQCHFFAGIGGWSLAARLAGWPDDRALWTGSCPCQPFSVAGKGEGQADERHLWPVFFGLISARRPDVVMGEQVAAAVGKHWLDGVCADLEGVDYAVGAAVVPACAVGAPHRRDRLWFVADTQRESEGRRGLHGPSESRGEAGSRAPAQLIGAGADGALAYSDGTGVRIEPGRLRRPNGTGARVDCDDCQDRLVADADSERSCSRIDDAPAGHRHPVATDDRQGAMADAQRAGSLPGTHAGVHRREEGVGSRDVEPVGHWSSWVGASSFLGADGKARRVEPGIRLLAHGVPARVGKLRAFGNAIVPQVAAEVIGAYLDLSP